GAARGGVGWEDDRRRVPAARDQRADVLRVASQVRVDDPERGAAAARAGAGERPAEEAAGRARPGGGRAQGVPFKKVSGSAADRRAAVTFLTTRWKLSQRVACGLAGISRSALAYQARRKDEPELVRDLKALARRHPRYGYRRLWAM